MSLTLVALGAALLAVAAGWRFRNRKQLRQRIDSLLEALDPETRAGAVRLVQAQGIERYAALLLRIARAETDDRVIAAILEVIDRTQAVPARRPEVVELRLWATSTIAAPKGASVSLPASQPAEPLPTSAIDSDPEVAASTLTVIVTGAGGPAGVAVIRALRGAGHRPVAVDADPMAVGLRLASAYSVVPRGDDPAFVKELIELADRVGATALIPTVSEELVSISEGAADLRVAGVSTWLPTPRAVQPCLDKWQFFRLMSSRGIAVPATGLGADFGVGIPGPWVVKPRFGRGSRDVFLVDDSVGISHAVSTVPDPIIQTRIAGREFTVDTLSDERGQLLGAVPRWRLETKGGISTKGLTFRDPVVLEGVEAVIEALGLAGPANVQGFLTETGAVFIEVNPRFSGGLPLSLAAGADLVGEYLRGVLGQPVRREHLRYRPGITMLRHFDEVFEG